MCAANAAAYLCMGHPVVRKDGQKGQWRSTWLRKGWDMLEKQEKVFRYMLYISACDGLLASRLKFTEERNRPQCRKKGMEQPFLNLHRWGEKPAVQRWPCSHNSPKPGAVRGATAQHHVALQHPCKCFMYKVDGIQVALCCWPQWCDGAGIAFSTLQIKKLVLSCHHSTCPARFDGVKHGFDGWCTWHVIAAVLGLKHAGIFLV